jgi:ankyrin repeat protein/tetratricopeptide (TPR) repeat protein
MDETSVLSAVLEPLTTHQLALLKGLVYGGPFASHHSLVVGSTTESYPAPTEIASQPTPKEAHARLAEACLKYLLLNDFAEIRPTHPVEPSMPLFTTYPLLSYCGRACMTHIRASQDLCQNYWQQIVAFLQQPNANFSCWWALVNEAPKSPDYPPLSVPALHICARYGLDEVANRILSLQDLPNLMPGRIEDRNPRGDTALMQAAMWGHASVVELLMSRGADIDARNNEGWRALMFACANEDIEMVSLLLRLGSQPGGHQEGQNCPLAIAAFTANKVTFDKLRERGVDENDRTIVMLKSIQGGNIDITRVLFRPSKDLKAEADSGATCLGLAVECGHIPMVEFLLSQGASLVSPRERWDSPLHVAARRGRVSMVDFLISKGCDLQQLNSAGETPIISALRAGNGEAGQQIAKGMGRSHLQRALDVAADDGSNAIHLAYEQNDMSSLQCLLDCGADPDFRSTLQHPPLLVLAIQRQDVSTVRLLLDDFGAKVDFYHAGKAPLHLAALTGNIEIVENIIDSVSDKNIKTTLGLTPTHIAARAGHISMIDTLVENGASLGLKDNVGHMEIHFASQGNHVTVVKAMLSRGQLPETESGAGLTALHMASMQGFSECVKILLDDMNARNVSLEMEDPDGYCALNHAAFGNHREVIRLLLEHGANVDHVTLLGHSPLHIAVKLNNMDAVQLLLEASADVNTQAFDGSTALICAAAAWHSESVRVLLDHKADISLRDKFGKNALDWASTNQPTLDILSRCRPRSTVDQQISLLSHDHLAREAVRLIQSLCSPFTLTLRFKTLDMLLSTLIDVEILRHNFGTAITLMEHTARLAKERRGSDFPRTPCRLCCSQDYVAYFRCQSCFPIILCDSCHESYRNGCAVGFCRGHEMLRIPKEGQLGSSAGIFNEKYATLEEWVTCISTAVPNNPDILRHSALSMSHGLQGDRHITPVRAFDITRPVHPTQGMTTSSTGPPGEYCRISLVSCLGLTLSNPVVPSRVTPHDSNPVDTYEFQTVDELSSSIVSVQNEIAMAKAHRLPSIIEQMRLCILTLRKAEKTGDIDDLKGAIVVANEALEGETTHEQRNAIIPMLALGLYTLANASQHIDDFDRGMQVMQQAICCSPSGPLRSRVYRYFTAMCRSRCDISKATVPDVDNKIRTITIAGTEVDDPTFPVLQKLVLSDLHSLIYDRSGSIPALDTAITLLTEAIDLDKEQTREEFPDRYEKLYDLYDQSYEASGSLDALDHAIRALRIYLETIQERNLELHRAIGLNNLAAALEKRTSHKKNSSMNTRASSIYEAEVLALEAVDAMKQFGEKDSVENIRGEMLTNLGNIYQRKFELLGDMEDMNTMIRYRKESLQKPMDPDQCATRLSNLGLAYKMRYIRTLELGDLEMGIDSATQAVKTGMVSKGTKSLCLQGLAELYKQECIRPHSSRGHLDLAIRLSKVALGFAQSASMILSSRETLLNLLGLRFDRYDGERDAKDTLAFALRSYSECIRDFRMEGASSHLTVIGNVYSRRSDDSSKTWNLTMAIRFHKLALKLSHTSSMHIPLGNLATAYMKRDRKDYPRAIKIFEVISRLPNLSLFNRIRATRAAARLAMSIEDWDNATRLWSQLFGHLPTLTMTLKSRVDLQHALGLLSGMADWAASALLKNDKMAPADILSLVEASRGQIAKVIIESRGPIFIHESEGPWQTSTTVDSLSEGMSGDPGLSEDEHPL